MPQNNLSIPTTLATPRCFVLKPVINIAQAYTQAGEYKSKAFGFDIKRAFSTIGRKKEDRIEAKLLHRRLVPFWQIKCRSHFDYTRINEYSIAAHDPEAVLLTLQGNDKEGQKTESEYRVDQSGRSKGKVRLTGIERCVKDRAENAWIDSYVRTDDLSPKDIDPQRKYLSDLALQNPIPIRNLEDFATTLTIDNTLFFEDDLETIVVPPLETADNVVRHTLRKVMIPIEAASIFDWLLDVSIVDLYFRPLYVFQFSRMDKEGNTIEVKLDELDAIKKDRWVNLQTTEYQMSTIPWIKILKLSADIGAIVLNDIPIVGTTMKVISAVAAQGPEIYEDMSK